MKLWLDSKFTIFIVPNNTIMPLTTVKSSFCEYHGLAEPQITLGFLVTFSYPKTSMIRDEVSLIGRFLT